MEDDGLLLKKLVRFMECRETLLDDGQTMVLLTIKEHQAIIVFFIYLQMAFSHHQQKPNPTIFMLGLHLTNREMIWNDRSLSYVINIQIIQLLKTLDQDLITKD